MAEITVRNNLAKVINIILKGQGGGRTNNQFLPGEHKYTLTDAEVADLKVVLKMKHMQGYQDRGEVVFTLDGGAAESTTSSGSADTAAAAVTGTATTSSKKSSSK